MLKGFSGDKKQLGSAEKFLLALVTIPGYVGWFQSWINPIHPLNLWIVNIVKQFVRTALIVLGENQMTAFWGVVTGVNALMETVWTLLQSWTTHLSPKINLNRKNTKTRRFRFLDLERAGKTSSSFVRFKFITSLKLPGSILGFFSLFSWSSTIMLGSYTFIIILLPTDIAFVLKPCYRRKSFRSH